MAFLAPFVDKDGVEEGDQERTGVRGTTTATTWASRSTRRPRRSGSKCRNGSPADRAWPSICTALYSVTTTPGSTRWARRWSASAEQQRFAEILATAARGTLPYRKTSFLPFGKAWNKAANYQVGIAFDRWAAEHEEMRLATSFEIPYAQASRVEVNPTSARAFGRDIATALAVYIRTFATATVGSRPKGTR